MLVIGLVLLFVLACFGFVLLFGAPYLPTLDSQLKIAFELADLQPGQTLLELGCGDGKVLIAAASMGCKAVGYELNPLLVVVCWLRTRRYRRLVRVHWGNFWTADWPPTDVIFVFALQKFMGRLDKKIIQSKHKPVKLVSLAFTIPDRQPTAKRGGICLYQYGKPGQRLETKT